MCAISLANECMAACLGTLCNPNKKGCCPLMLHDHGPRLWVLCGLEPADSQAQPIGMNKKPPIHGEFIWQVQCNEC